MSDGMIDAALEPLADKERIQRLEERLTSRGSNGLPVASVTVGFEPTSRSSSAESRASGIARGTNSNKSAASDGNSRAHTSQGIAESKPPSSKRRQKRHVPDSPPNLGGEQVNNADAGFSNPQKMASNISRKRKLAPEISSSVSSSAKFSREDDSAIMHAAFFERTSHTWLELARKLGKTEPEIKERYRELMNEAARVDTDDPRQNYSLDIISRTNNSMSHGGLSYEATSRSNGGGQHGDANDSRQRGAVGEDGGNTSRSKSRKDRTASPMTSRSDSLRKALQNQTRLSQFFVPVGGGGEKRKKLSEHPTSSALTRSSSIVAESGPPSKVVAAEDIAVEGTAWSTSTRTEPSGKPFATPPRLERVNSMQAATPMPIGGSLSAGNSSDTGATTSAAAATITTTSSSSSSSFVSTSGSSQRKKSYAELEQGLRERERQVERLTAMIRERDSELASSKQLMELQVSEMKDLQATQARLREHSLNMSDKTAKVLEQLIRKVDADLQKYQRKKLVEEGFRLGRIVVQHGFGKPSEIWEEGQEFKALRAKRGELLQRREEADKRKKVMLKDIKHRRGSSSSDALSDLEAIEALAASNSSLKRTEQELNEQQAKLEREKIFHVRSIKRMREEDASRFKQQPVLNNRYLLRSLLGKGGFSEVWRGFDLIELRDVAVKVHELNSAWSEERRVSYLKHATREYQIHLNLAHPRIVQLYDVFQIDDNSFATVLEFCQGTDLELHLKWRRTLPEREARAIMLQILSGLRYLNSGIDMENSEASATSDSAASASGSSSSQTRARPSIIHYDLKPGNILFDRDGGVKITDFGLSKIMDNGDNDTGIELTSQGAGTYWYLPPECFHNGVVHISSKVDVWSCGVILFQMLYGKRPFGEGLSQDRILRNHTMLKATRVEFPAKPSISDEAKSFIRRCLTYEQRLRPDVQTICKDPYLTQHKLK